MLFASSARSIGKSRQLASGTPSARAVCRRTIARAPREQGRAERARQPIAQAQRVEAHDAPDAARPGHQIGADGIAHSDAEHFDLCEVVGEQIAELRGLVFVHVIGIDAVREGAVGSGEQRRAGLDEDRRDRAHERDRIGEVFDHLEAHHGVEAVRAHGQSGDVGQAEVGAGDCGWRGRAGRGRCRRRASRGLRAGPCPIRRRSRGRGCARLRAVRGQIRTPLGDGRGPPRTARGPRAGARR